MSSDTISSVPNPEAVRVQGAPQHVSRVPEQRKVDSVENNKLDPERNESTAPGKGLPPDPVDKSEEVAQVESAVSKISDFVQNFQRDLQFSIDEDSDRLVVKVLDSETQKVIRQIPSEETLRIAQHLDSPESLILREQA